MPFCISRSCVDFLGLQRRGEKKQTQMRSKSKDFALSAFLRQEQLCTCSLLQIQIYIILLLDKNTCEIFISAFLLRIIAAQKMAMCTFSLFIIFQHLPPSRSLNFAFFFFLVCFNFIFTSILTTYYRIRLLYDVQSLSTHTHIHKE